MIRKISDRLALTLFSRSPTNVVYLSMSIGMITRERALMRLHIKAGRARQLCRWVYYEARTGIDVRGEPTARALD